MSRWGAALLKAEWLREVRQVAVPSVAQRKNFHAAGCRFPDGAVQSMERVRKAEFVA